MDKQSNQDYVAHLRKEGGARPQAPIEASDTYEVKGCPGAGENQNRLLLGSGLR